MSAPLLGLCPADPQAPVPERRLVQAALERLGLLGPPVQVGDLTHHLPGPQFLELVTFLGCSPRVAGGPREAAADAGAAYFCHVRVRGPEPELLARTGPNTVPPRCPRCRQRLAAWAQALEDWRHEPTRPWRCTHCGAAMPLPGLDWRQNAAFGRVFVEIWGVHPAEAVPSERLLQELRAVTGFEWSFFYLQDATAPEGGSAAARGAG
jgi:hypothetical protein